MTVLDRPAAADPGTANRLWRTAAGVVGGAGLCAAADAAYLHQHLPAGQVTIWLLFGCVALAFTRLPRATFRQALPLVILGAAVVQLPGLSMPPQSSTDAYRYVWDGRVQLAGHSPYTMAPLDDRLADLRDPILFPGLTPQDRTGVDSLDDNTQDDPRTRINRPHVPTIYPPVAQLWFTGIAAVTPRSAGTFGVQLAAALAAIATAALLAAALSRTNRKPWAALGFAVSPAIALEAGNNGHVDVLATLLIVAAVTTVHHRIRSGVLLGLAAGVKIVPLLLVPAIRTGLRGRLATGTTFAGSYLPHVLVAGWLVLGYLPGYLGEEGFDDGGGRYAVLAMVLPESARAPAALVIGAVLAVVAWRRAAEHVSVTATWLFGAALLLGTPTYPWYTVPLLALAVLAGRWEWLAVVVAAYGAYASYEEPAHVSVWYLAALAVVASTAVIRQATRLTRPVSRS